MATHHTSPLNNASARPSSAPPQAYTREILVKAINWIQGQPPAVRARATSADLVVSHYLQACRRADMQSTTPVSGETFREDLKNLAADLKQFEEPVVAPPTPPSFSHGPVYTSTPEITPPVQMPAPPPLQTPPPTVAPPSHEAPLITWSVDARSLSQARELQERLNLGSETEALRVLITLGAEKARELF